MNSFVSGCLAELSADGFISGFRIKERCTAKNPAGFFLFLVPFLDLLVRPFALWFADIWNQKFQCCISSMCPRLKIVYPRAVVRASSNGCLPSGSICANKRFSGNS